MIVIADTSPLCYLVLINQIDILPALYSQIIIPKAVADELAASASPEVIQQWIAQPPRWLHINSMEVPETLDTQLDNLDPGERAVIFLATQMMTNFVVLDGCGSFQVKDCNEAGRFWRSFW